MKIVTSFLLLMSFLFYGTVADARANKPAPGTEKEIAELAQEIRSLGPDVDPEEAMRAARITYDYTYQLALEYQITDRPLIHNTKVNMGAKPRGLCWHWAEDIEKRLNQENFQTLEMHRAMANAFNIRLEHSTSIISRKGDDYLDGIVLDPWRKGGVLFWSRTLKDKRYKWLPRDEVFAKKRKLKKHKNRRNGDVRKAQLQGGRN